MSELLVLPKVDQTIIQKKIFIFNELKKLINSDNVLSHDSEIKPYETDALAAYKQKPLAVVLPENTEEVSEGASDIEEELQRVQAVSAAMQQQALTALLSTLDSEFLTLSEDIISLIPPKAYGYTRTRESFSSQTGLTFDPISAAEASAKHTLTFLLNKERLARLQQQAAWYQKKGNSGKQVNAIFSVQQVITQLVNSTIRQGPETGLALLVQQRVNQQIVEQLSSLLRVRFQ